VFLIRFLKGKAEDSDEYLRRLEPEIKMFAFEKSEKPFSELTPEEREEETQHIRNAIGYARKVLTTGECDVLILDEILGLAKIGILDIEEYRELIGCAAEGMELILTGKDRCEALWPDVDEVTEVVTAYRADQSFN